MDAGKTAQKRFVLENKIENASDEIYSYDRKAQQDMLQAKLWEKDPNYFKVRLFCQTQYAFPYIHVPIYFQDVKISALALLKMVMHARSGGNLEVMGLVQGKVDAHTMIVMDSFALPVEGTETRVNAQAQVLFSYQNIVSRYT